MKTLLAVAVLFSACDWKRSEAPGPVPDHLILRTYEVPGGSAPQVLSALRNLLWFGSRGEKQDIWAGRADVTPSGGLVVLATDDVQSGVKSLIDSLAHNPPKPAPTV